MAQSDFSDDDFEDAFMSSEAAKSIGIQPCEKNTIKVLEDFGFSFRPYEIQQCFMQEMYKVLENGRIGIFESPTGTGKSLSLLCASISWLKNFEAMHLAEMQRLTENNSSKTDTSNWLEEFEQEKELKQLRFEAEAELKKRQELGERLKHANESLMGVKRNLGILKRKKDIEESEADYQLLDDEWGKNDADADVILEDYSSDEKEKCPGPSKSFLVFSDGQHSEEEEPFSCRKIYFCSRTHSQLNQVVKEVKKTKFADQLRVVTLGSRKTLCVNDRVSTLKSSNAINEACLQMQLKSSSKITKAKDGQRRKCPSKCPYFRPEAIQRLADIYIRDIEDLTAAGRRMAACPYYASRYAVAAAELVLLPYQMILHQTTRESCSLPLGGNVVIIDEAHNLLDALDEMYSSEVDGRLLELCSVQLDRYLGRYSKRLNAKNLVYVRQLSLVVANFLKYLKTNSDKKGDSQVMTINDFTFTTDTDAVNWFKVIRYVEKSQICRKMRGFALRFGEEVRTASDEGSGASGSMLPAAGCFDTLVSFLRAISGSSKDCRLIYFRGDQFVCGRLKIVCLNPAAHIRNVLDEAHSVILAGGTLEPVDELYDRLFDLCSIARSRISHFSCGHIVPKENLLPVIVCRGPRGGNMRFNYQTRTQPALMTELGQILISLATVVPGGVVCFFSSYGYLSAVCDALSSDSMLQELETLKRVFIEPKNASQVPSLLKEYAENVQAGKKGAMLFAVVGGKMSEGINFSDDLGRCVAMIGLPYANVKSIELQTKVNFLNAMKLTDGKADRGKTYFSNLCFKAVNQSIGRAIRHSNDYASIVLIDSRFHENACQRKLPKWISDNLVEPPTFSECCVLLTSFYNNCRSRYAKETDTF